MALREQTQLEVTLSKRTRSRDQLVDNVFPNASIDTLEYLSTDGLIACAFLGSSTEGKIKADGTFSYDKGSTVQSTAIAIDQTTRFTNELRSKYAYSRVSSSAITGGDLYLSPNVGRRYYIAEQASATDLTLSFNATSFPSPITTRKPIGIGLALRFRRTPTGSDIIWPSTIVPNPLSIVVREQTQVSTGPDTAAKGVFSPGDMPQRVRGQQQRKELKRAIRYPAYAFDTLRGTPVEGEEDPTEETIRGIVTFFTPRRDLTAIELDGEWTIGGVDGTFSLVESEKIGQSEYRVVLFREIDVEQALATKINRPSLQQTGVASVTPPPIPTKRGIGISAYGSTPSLQLLGLYPQSDSISFRGIDLLPTSPFAELTSRYYSIFWWQYPTTLRPPRTITFTETGTAIPGSLTSHVVVAGDALRMYEVRRATPWSIDGFHIRLFQSEGASFYRRTTHTYTGTINF